MENSLGDLGKSLVDLEKPFRGRLAESVGDLRESLHLRKLGDYLIRVDRAAQIRLRSEYVIRNLGDLQETGEVFNRSRGEHRLQEILHGAFGDHLRRVAASTQREELPANFANIFYKRYRLFASIVFLSCRKI